MEQEVGEAGVGFLRLAMEGSALGIEVLAVSIIAVLGALVVVRTFLSWSLVVEIEGRWPWQAAGGGAAREES